MVSSSDRTPQPPCRGASARAGPCLLAGASREVRATPARLYVRLGASTWPWCYPYIPLDASLCPCMHLYASACPSMPPYALPLSYTP